jgi:hypothetical protein
LTRLAPANRDASARSQSADFALDLGANGAEAPTERALLAGDWSALEDCLARLSNSNGVVITLSSTSNIDAVFRLRGLQLLVREGCLEAPSAVVISDGGDSELAPGLRRRIASSWPFRSVIFVAEGAAAVDLAAEGLPVVSRLEAAQIGLVELLRHPGAERSAASEDQAIGVQVQPMWGRCGSSTAFANQVDCLIDEGMFPIRIFVDDHLAGETIRRRFPEVVRQNVLDTAACIEAMACAQSPNLEVVDNEYDLFRVMVGQRTRASIQEPRVSDLVRLAKVAIVNHAANVGFAARHCPDARLVLDTHDYVSRNAFDRARLAGDERLFPSLRVLRRHVELEHLLWRAADTCVTVSPEEAKRIQAQSPECILVLPQPYARRWVDPGAAARWDLVLVADQHAFNVKSVDWFLDEVVRPNPPLRACRIAIVGNVRRHLEHLWAEKLPNVAWLGFVADLDEVRNRSRLAVCPDQGGTGVSVKTLTALAAGQPLVATSEAMRGLPRAVAAALRLNDTPAAMAADITALLASNEACEQRQRQVASAFAMVRDSSGYRPAIQAASSKSERALAARREIIRRFASSSVALPPEKPFVNGVIELAMNHTGAAGPFLRSGWHDAESWGRWTDGQIAKLSLLTEWFDEPSVVEVRFADVGRPRAVEVLCDGRIVTEAGASTGDRSLFIRVEEATSSHTGEIDLEIHSDGSFCPADGGGADERVLGAPIQAVRVLRPQVDFQLGAAKIELGSGGKGAPLLRSGWRDAEPWGRWTDGRNAAICLPSSWLHDTAILEVRLAKIARPPRVVLRSKERVLAISRGDRRLVASIDRTMLNDEGSATIELGVVPRSWSSRRHRRRRGVAIEALTVFQPGVGLSGGDVCLNLARTGENAEPFLGPGWGAQEIWGRRTRGARATINLPAQWFETEAVVEVQFMDLEPEVGVGIIHRGQRLTPRAFTTRRRLARFWVDKSMGDAAGLVKLEIVARSTLRQRIRGESAEVCIGVQTITVAALPVSAEGCRLDFRIGGNASAFLGSGWHGPELWGRWTDGRQAALSLPAEWFVEPADVELRFVDIGVATRAAVLHRGRALTPRGFNTRHGLARFPVDGSMIENGRVKLEVVATRSFRPSRHGDPSDSRTLGVAVQSLSVRPRQPTGDSAS